MKNIPLNIVLGFDFGMKRIGVAVGQTVTRQARPLGTVKALQGLPEWQTLDHYIKLWQPDAFIIGIPFNMDGTTQPLTQIVRAFAESLQQRYTVPYYEMDERLTTVEARDYVFQQGGYKALKKAEIDSFAAQLIVQNWLKSTF